MAKRNANVIKLKKQKRMRRAYLKGFDMGSLIRVKRKIGTAHIPEEHLAYFDYNRRANTYWDDYLEKKFPSRGIISKERLAALDKLNQLTEEVIPEMNVIVHKGGITKTLVRFYFATDFMKCFFMKEDWIEMVMWKSTTYYGSMSRDRAYFDLNNNRVEWVEKIPIT